MDDVEDNLNSSVGFLYKTMLERDPRKRRVKPVQPHLLQLDFAGLDNSSDDSDFKVGDESDDDDDVDDEDENEESSGKEDSGDDKDASDKASVSSSNDSLTAKRKSADVKQDQSVVNDVHISFDPVASSASIKKLKVSICCVCLGDSSMQDNEIVECDSCGASVHEGCYGITEVASVGSSASSASTEPWFCDSCKAGIKPRCELCPNQGGIFKETDTGRWVHLVCALYVPGVAFGDVDKLTMVTLFEMSYTKWGSKECCLCDDERFARTGVCIGCDAGLCRSYFHVTCAQKEGMLTEAAPDEDIADPFFAYCKQHANKALVRVKRRNWLAVQSNMKNFESRLSEKEKLRVQKKLTVHQQTFAMNKEKQLANAWVPMVKMPRMLHTSSYAVLQLLKKAELLGHAHHQTEVSDRKKSHFPPMLSSDFASYYNDRNSRIGNLKQRIHELKIQREKMQVQETQLHGKYELLVKEIAHEETVGGKLQSDGEMLWNILSSYASKRMKWSGTVHFQRSPRTSPKKVTAGALPGLVQRCDTCKKTHDQHLLAKCDNCCMYHHLGCLDPPLTRMPKKTKQQGWQCSRCVSHDDTSKDEAPDVDTNEPRRLRDKFHDPLQYTSLFQEHRCQPRKPAIKRPRRPPRPVEVVEDLGGERCKDCRGVTDANNCVKCDKCCRSQHLGCLTPPRTRTPRIRGYVWFCDECQRSVTSESPSKDKQQSPVGSQLPDASEKSAPNCSSVERKKRVLIRKSFKKLQLPSPSSKTGLPISETTVAKSRNTSRERRIVGAKRPKFALPGTRRTKHHPDVSKISSKRIIRRALVSGRRLKDKDRLTSAKKRPKKPVACRVKSNVEREFFYSSRNDPMRRPLSAVSPSSTVENDDSE